MQKLLLTLKGNYWEQNCIKFRSQERAWFEESIHLSNWQLSKISIVICVPTEGLGVSLQDMILGKRGNSTWSCAPGQFTALCKGYILFNWKYGAKSIILPHPRSFCAMICLILLQYLNENAILSIDLLSYQDQEIKMAHWSCACACTLFPEFKLFCKTNMKFACFTTIPVTMEFCYPVYLILIQINDKKKQTQNNLMLQKNQLFTDRQSGRFELRETFKLLKWEWAESSLRQPAAFSHAWNTDGINCHQTGNGSERAGMWDAKRKKGLHKVGKKGHASVGERPGEIFENVSLCTWAIMSWV